MERDLIVLEDGRQCVILNEFFVNDKKYLLLINKDDGSDFIIRKKNNNEIVGLDDEFEFENVIKKIINKEKDV